MIATGTQVDPLLWDQYVNGSEGSVLYHLYGWKQVIEETFGHRTFYLAATECSRVVGVLPLVELRSRLFGNMLVSLPFFNYGGICAETPEVRDALLEASIRVAAERNADFIEIRHQDQSVKGLPSRTSKVSMRLELPESPDVLWKSFSSKLRNQVQKPRKEGMTAVIGREEELDSFYDVFSVNMRDLGTPVYSKTFFRNILRRFPDRTRLVTVWFEGKPVAAGFLAGFKDRLEIPWASSLRAFNKLGPNMLLYWTCVDFACRSGYRVFDFGRSTPGEGTYRFKEQWGARPHQLYWHYWIRNGGEIPHINPKNPKYRAAIAAWRLLPVSLSRHLGPRIVKYIP